VIAVDPSQPADALAAIRTDLDRRAAASVP
jgi:hypothetical protein